MIEPNYYTREQLILALAKYHEFSMENPDKVESYEDVKNSIEYAESIIGSIIEVVHHGKEILNNY